MKQTKKENRITLRKKLFDIIINHAEQGKIPPERILAEMLNVNRFTLRQCLEELIEEGKLYRKPRKGTYVAEYIQNATTETLTAIMSHNSDKVESSLFKDLMALRILVERECVRLASLNINSPNVITFLLIPILLYFLLQSELLLWPFLL